MKITTTTIIKNLYVVLYISISNRIALYVAFNFHVLFFYLDLRLVFSLGVVLLTNFDGDHDD